MNRDFGCPRRCHVLDSLSIATRLPGDEQSYRLILSYYSEDVRVGLGEDRCVRPMVPAGSGAGVPNTKMRRMWWCRDVPPK